MNGQTSLVSSGPAAQRSKDLPPAVLALLEQGTAPGSEPPRLLQTHISWVVLAGPYVYKLKKPLALGFLDYSTPEKRLEACHREVALNRRLCPWVYLGVMPISGESVKPDGSRTVLDYAVRMRRLPQDRMLDVLLDRGEATNSMMEALAERLADFHTFAATGPGIDEHGSPTAIWANAAENFRQTRPFLGRTLDARTWALVRWSSMRFLEENLELFKRRVARGRIRDGHGDLHAANICMTEPIAIFDCIEFNDRFRCGDVAAEVAFLAMDLEYRHRADLATAFVDRYVEVSGDHELRDVLDFYICYRAYVRGKVESLKLDEPGFSAEENGTALARARRYFDLSRSYAIRLASTVDRAALSVA
jgi:uncharacterized protein